MTKEEILEKAASLIVRVNTVLMATIDFDEEPEVRTMTNLRSADLYPSLAGKFSKYSFKTYIPVNTNSGKLVQIRRNPKGSIYYTDAANFESLLVLGSYEQVLQTDIKNEFWQDRWSPYFPKGKDDSDYTLLLFKPRKFKYYGGKDMITYESNISD